MFIVIAKNQKPEKKESNDKIEDEQGKFYFLYQEKIYLSSKWSPPKLFQSVNQSSQPFPATKAERGRGIILRKELNKKEFTVSPIK